MSLIRWLLFLSIGYPFQVVVYILYPIVHLYWYLFVFEYKKEKIPSNHDYNVTADMGSKTRAEGKLLDNPDNHGALSMYGFIQSEGLRLLHNEHGDLARRYPDDYDRVSGDTVVCWCFAYMFSKSVDKESILLVATNYLKNLGTRSYDAYGQGYVSGRCNSFGLNVCLDVPYVYLGQPAAGPQYYANAAVFALASQHSTFFKFVFWIHWVLMGGWYWAFSPIIYSKQQKLFYGRDIVMKALYVQREVFGNKWWIRKPMEFITDTISEGHNDLFAAMMGREINPLPVSMDRFFSQNINGSSQKDDSMSPYIPLAVKEIQEKSKKYLLT